MELRPDLVSLIAPFYNGADYLDRFLKSVLAQSYTNVQFILVNDGSTDNSNAIVEKYGDRLKEKFTEFLYLHKANGGAGSAVNAALKYVKGEYLCWADCDDEMLAENIERKYRFLKNNPDYGMVNCGAQAIDQITGCVIKILSISEQNQNANMFHQIINGIPVYSGVFMVRTKCLLEKLKNREIYFNREVGQNYQLLLPVAYDAKCGFIPDVLYSYYVHNDSHSRNVDFEKAYQRTFAREVCLDNILSFMPQEEKKDLMQKIHEKAAKARFNISFSANDKIRNNEAYKDLRASLKSIPIKDKIKHMIINIPILNLLYRKRS